MLWEIRWIMMVGERWWRCWRWRGEINSGIITLSCSLSIVLVLLVLVPPCLESSLSMFCFVLFCFVSFGSYSRSERRLRWLRWQWQRQRALAVDPEVWHVCAHGIHAVARGTLANQTGPDPARNQARIKHAIAIAQPDLWLY